MYGDKMFRQTWTINALWPKWHMLSSHMVHVGQLDPCDLELGLLAVVWSHLLELGSIQGTNGQVTLPLGHELEQTA